MHYCGGTKSLTTMATTTAERKDVSLMILIALKGGINRKIVTSESTMSYCTMLVPHH